MDNIQFQPTFIYAVAASTLILLWSITKRILKNPTQNKNLPPSPPKLPILGSLHQLGSSLPHRRLHTLAEKHGPIMLLHFGPIPVLVISSPDAAREIMKTHDVNFSNRAAFRVQKKLLYDRKNVSLLPHGERWRQVRKFVVLRLLSSKKVQSFHSILKDETALLMSKIRERSPAGPVDLTALFSELTSYVVGRAAFGSDYRASANGKTFSMLLREFSELLPTVSIGDFVPCLRWVSRVNGVDRKVNGFARRMDEFMEGVIEERLETREGAEEESFLDILIQICYAKTGDVSIDRDAIKGILLDMFAAGADTTSTAIEWTMTELLRHPKIMAKLQKEVREIVGVKHGVTHEDLEKMHYLKAVIKESFRYHPPIPLLAPRLADKDVNVKGYDVSAGTIVMVNAWSLGRDPLCWAEPEKFDPERFLNCSVDFKGFDFELIPFGAGRRGCPGIAFSTAAIEFVLASLVNEFNLELPDGARGEDLDVTERSGVTVRKNIPLIAIAT